jgi:hypothetical protein
MKKLLLIIMAAVLLFGPLSGQSGEPTPGIKFSGFVKNDIFLDTRQSTAALGLREGHFYLFPDNKVLDINGKDINANTSLHFLSIQTRLKGDITGPDAFGAKTSGTIEAEFFGTSEADINGFRLRHAFVKLDWAKTTLISGQFWHPMFITESFPGTISFNTGAPFQPFSRNPQVRLIRSLGKISLSATAYGQRDFTTPGPDGNSNKYLRNSCVPGLDLQLKVTAGEAVTGWAGFGYKRIRPELRTLLNLETKENLGSISAYLNFKIRTAPLLISMMGVYAQNAADLMMTGGYAISSTDLLTQYRTYTNLNTGSAWLDLSTTGTKVVAGLFAGYSKNLGSSDLIDGSVYGRGTDVDHLLRVSPRISFNSGKLTFAAETEYTAAAYGTRMADGKVSGTDTVANLRLLFSTIYRF